MRPVRLTFCLLALSLCFAPSVLAQCGDCDLNMSVDIVDALTAAQIASSMVMPTPAQLISCDVDSSGAVDILDALLIAQASAGLQVSLTCPGTPPSTAPNTGVGYCITGNLNTNDNWDIVVVDTDPFTSTTFTLVPPSTVAEIQFATAISPWPMADAGSSVQAFIAAINGTQPFTDLVNTAPAAFVALQIAVPGMNCFTPISASSAPGLPMHFASVGIAYADGTTCFPEIGGPNPICSYNPDLTIIQYETDEDGNVYVVGENPDSQDNGDNPDDTPQDSGDGDENADGDQNPDGDGSG